MRRIKIDLKEMTLKQGFEEFLKDRERNGASEATIKSYKGLIPYFFKYYPTENMCEDITLGVYEGYKEYLLERHENKNTINTYLRHARTMLNYFMEHGYTQTFKMKLIKVGETKKVLPDDDTIFKLLKRPDMKTCSFPEYRTWVILNYIIATGNRIGTIRCILNEDINYKEKTITLRHTKNGDTTVIGMPEALKPILSEYQEIRKGNPNDYLFCTQTGTQISSSGMQTAMRRYADDRGVDVTSQHLLRHLFAKKFYINSGDIMALSMVLGHKSLQMTRHYLNTLMVQDIGSMVESANPLNQFTGRVIKMRK